VYFRRIEPADSLLDYALFISLFPHLIAGPIQRPSHLLPQVQQVRHYNRDAFFDGLMLIASGLFRKCVVADNCAVLANAAFAGSLGSGVVPLVIGVYAFSWQIYGDFSGYSDIARGSAQLLGFHFMVNFRQPYFASSLQDFWRRWHISLSTWLRDYLYIPLGGNRKGVTRTYINLLLTMLLGGLWHGASWTFVVWGALHGAWLSIERFVWRGEAPQPRWYSRVLTLAVVGVAWVFFRARTVEAAWMLLSGVTHFSWNATYLPVLLFLAVISSMMIAIDWVNEKGAYEYALQNTAPPLRIALAASFMLIVIFAGGSQVNAFIYFQF
jgi:alginate O-acetyltransferase complex protein AlgI